MILGRLRELGFIDWTRYGHEHRADIERIAALPDRAIGSGGNAYNTIPVRTSRRFAEALIAGTLEGLTLYRDAFRLLGVKSQTTFDDLAHRLGAV